jgi:hypothetical protein
MLLFILSLQTKIKPNFPPGGIGIASGIFVTLCTGAGTMSMVYAPESGMYAERGGFTLLPAPSKNVIIIALNGEVTTIASEP